MTKLTRIEGPTATIRGVCQCDKEWEVVCSSAGWLAWRGGELIQNALPELGADDRELLKTGTCSACWDAMFTDEEDPS